MMMPQDGFEHKKGRLIFLVALVLGVAFAVGAFSGYFAARGESRGFLQSLVLVPLIPLSAYLLYRLTIFPSYRRLEDDNLELRLKQEELLDVKDDLFIKFLGVYDVNFAANSPRLFADRLTDVADITARVMGADACFVFLYDRKKDHLVLSATNGVSEAAIGAVRIPLGEGLEGWVGRRLEPLMLRDFRADARYREAAGMALGDYQSVYCLPLYVYSNGALVGVMEVFFRKAKEFTDEEINFFTTLTGILSTTIQNEQMQTELRKMNMELEQWVAEKTEELRASEERYRTLVENACESIFLLTGNGDVVFANEQGARLTGFAKYELLHKNFFEFFVNAAEPREILIDVAQGRQSLRHGDLKMAGGGIVPVEVSAVGLALMGKRFVQAVVRDVSTQMRLERLLEEKERELAALRAGHGDIK
jgi:PAS domain S-box-containing protein